MKTPLTYNEAYSQLENLVADLEDDNIQLDSLAKKVIQANELIGVCEEKLRGIEAEVGEAMKKAKS